MRFIEDASERVEKKVGGTDYGYIYLPKAWIGSKAVILRLPSEDKNQSKKPPKLFRKFKLFARKKLEANGFSVSDELIKIHGEEISPLFVGNKKSRTVVVSACFNKVLKSGDVDTRLSSAFNVLYIVASKNSKVSVKASKKMKDLVNVVLWRC